MDIFGRVEVSNEDAAVIARGLWTLSRVDGHEEREGLLIKSLWMDAVGHEHELQLQELEALTDVSPADLARNLRSTDIRALFMKTALLLAYADGGVSDKERTWLNDAGKALGYERKEIEFFDELVRSFLLSQLSHVANTDATAEVARKLGFK